MIEMAYVTPEVEVIEVEVEKGFATSDGYLPKTYNRIFLLS